MKHIVCDTIPTDIEHLGDVVQKDGQLHFIVMDDATVVKDAVYEATWDGKAKALTVLKGDPAALTLRYYGWPEA